MAAYEHFSSARKTHCPHILHDWLILHSPKPLICHVCSFHAPQVLVSKMSLLLRLTSKAILSLS